ncbi:MAG TPA: type II toxin-antitoxin system HicA family toxin [Coriobacteriia bacterium]
MTRREKLVERVMTGDAPVRFADLVTVAEWHGFVRSRTRGSHVLLVHESTGALLTLQADGQHAKRYQVDQFRKLVRRYNLRG